MNAVNENVQKHNQFPYWSQIHLCIESELITALLNKKWRCREPFKWIAIEFFLIKHTLYILSEKERRAETDSIANNVGSPF